MRAKSARELAFLTLRSIWQETSHPNVILSRILEESTLSALDRALCTELVYGVLRWRLALDWTIQKFSNRQISSLPPGLLDILRLAAYQLIYLDRIPATAAINEAVNMAKNEFHLGIGGYTNGVLRSLERGLKEISLPERSRDPIEFLSVKYSQPPWLVSMWIEEIGETAAEEILEASNVRPKVKIRTNLLKITRLGLVKRLKERGIESDQSDLTKQGIVVHSGNVASLPEFKAGLFTIQDEGSMLVSSVVDPDEGSRVLDFCAGQGGKTTHLAELMGGRGEITAIDTSEERLKNLSLAIRRLSLKNICPIKLDGTKASSVLKNDYDRVLVDAPCSGLGVLARRPDIRWKRSIADIQNLASLQYDLLSSASNFLKPKGRLVYSVCTISKRETTEVVEKFLHSHDGFKLEDLSKRNDLRRFGKDKTIQLLPGGQLTDGMFIASFIKK